MKPVMTSKERCCSDMGDGCIALTKKDCVGCAFFKSVEQKEKDDMKTLQRLRKLKVKK